MNPFFTNPYFDAFQILSDQKPELQLQLRKKLIWVYSWAIPSEEAVRKIASLGPSLEWGAGTGYWAWLVQLAGGKITAFDFNVNQPPVWVPIQESRNEVWADHSDCNLFLCWPPSDSDMASSALKTYRGARVIYVGEWRGRTGDSEFHDLLEKNWHLVQRLKLPNWPGYRDELFVLERK